MTPKCDNPVSSTRASGRASRSFYRICGGDAKSVAKIREPRIPVGKEAPGAKAGSQARSSRASPGAPASSERRIR
jgi:hypothetical protein